MNKIASKFTTTLLAGAVLSALTISSAHALAIKAEVSGSVGGAAFTTDTDGPASSGSVDVLDSAVSSDSMSDVFYHTYGDDNGDFGSRVSGNGVFDITGIFTYSDTITNNSGTDQAYNFDFTVIPGELALSGSLPNSGESLFAEYQIDILVDGVSIWDSAASLSKTSGSSAVFSNYGSQSLGGILSTTDAYTRYSWDEYIDSVALATLAVGESIDFEYRLMSHATGNSDCYSGDYEENFDGVLFELDVIQEDGIGFRGGESMGTCGAIARSGDPFHFGGSNPNFSSISSQAVNTANVPEPGILALFGLGFAGLFAAKRRKS